MPLILQCETLEVAELVEAAKRHQLLKYNSTKGKLITFDCLKTQIQFFKCFLQVIDISSIRDIKDINVVFSFIYFLYFLLFRIWGKNLKIRISQQMGLYKKIV